MKLLTELQKQVGDMGLLRYAWFTSFNMDIEFVETYVLPATLGADTPRKRIEYEQLQRELTDKDIDFRVFCDPRFLETNRVKRTAIPVYGIRPACEPEVFSDASLFHPKVIYLEDCDGKRVIGAGSANLTLSGWGRNLEAFRFFEVTTYKNYKEIRLFFERLCFAAGVSCDLRDRRRFSQERENWCFVHSYQTETFPSQLLGGRRITDLAVWSPYLPRDLAGFIRTLQAAAGVESLRVHLVPDRIEGKYLRTEWTESLSRMMAEKDLTFYDSRAPRHPNTELCHAKIWKGPGRLAVGSWNFTGPGSNSLRDPHGNWSPDNNVEAGFLIADCHDWREVCGRALNIGSSDCASSESLEREGLVVNPLPPFDLHVSFDWRTLAYAFHGKWLVGRPHDGYSVCLPGVGHAVPLTWNAHRVPIQPRQFRVDDSALLRDRVFKVNCGDTEVQRALVRELNATFRRTQSFETLQDLLEAFVHGDDPRFLDDLPMRIPPDDGTWPEDTAMPAVGPGTEPDCDPPTRVGISYFRLFHSMHAYQEKLSQLKKLEELDCWVFSWPGCLVELVGKIREELLHSRHDVFNWFLANEVNALCKFAHTRRRSLVRGAKEREPSYTAIPEARWRELAFELPELPAGISIEYAELVGKQCNYG